MNAVAIGPLVFATDRFAVLLGILVFLGITVVFSRRFGPTIAKWSNAALIGGLVSARLGHVVHNWQGFAAEPWRIFAFWQGGFQPVAGLIGVLIVSALLIRSLKTGLCAAFALGIGFLVWFGATELTKVTMGRSAPLVALNQLEGPTLVIADLAPKAVVVNLWASWCPPCRREMPLFAETASKRKDVAFLMVNQGEDKETIRSYLASGKLKFDHVLTDELMHLPRHYETIGLPVTLFLRTDGTLTSMHIGEISRETLNDNIDKISGVP